MDEKYIQALQGAIRQMHGCESRYVGAVPVKEAAAGKTLWQGNVELFDLSGCPSANRCYAWGLQDEAGQWQCVAFLNVPPVDTARKAVQAYLLSQQRKQGGMARPETR